MLCALWLLTATEKKIYKKNSLVILNSVVVVVVVETQQQQLPCVIFLEQHTHTQSLFHHVTFIFTTTSCVWKQLSYKYTFMLGYTHTLYFLVAILHGATKTAVRTEFIKNQNSFV